MPLPDDPISRAYRSGVMDRPPAADMKPDELIGFSGFPGIAQETGKVVREVADAGKLNPGDTMITEHTRPSWTLLVARAAALVTDGGRLYEPQRRSCPRIRHTGGCRKRHGNSGHQVRTGDRSGRNRRKGSDGLTE
jgi:hypothetical protein